MQYVRRAPRLIVTRRATKLIYHGIYRGIRDF